MWTIAEGSPGLQLDEIAHVFVPGRGRDRNGYYLSRASRERVLHAADFYNHQALSQQMGRIICSGYKTPRDHAGMRWTTPEEPGEFFMGIPEAEMARRLLISRGIGRAAIGVERHSIDTVTNFAYTEAAGHFGDERPVAIVAQAAHLARMLDIIAPKTLRRDYLGIVVPEGPEPDSDALSARLMSQAMLLGLSPRSRNLARRVSRRSKLVWRLAGKKSV